MSTQTINISLPKALVEEIDKVAKREFSSRSDYIRAALVNKLKVDKTQFDDWDLLESLSIEIGANARNAGYISDQDFVRVVKEVRSDRLAKANNKK